MTHSELVEIEGHLIDTAFLSKVLNDITDYGGDYRVDRFDICTSCDGDRFFYLNDPALPAIQQLFGISARRSLAQIIRADTGAAVQDDVFEVPAE